MKLKKTTTKKLLQRTCFALSLFVLLLPVNALAAFNPSYIMPDTTFTNTATMTTEGQIQEFLVARGSFLANYTIPASHNATYYIGQNQVTSYINSWIGPIGQEVNAEGWPVARVILKAAEWYGVNPQFIIAVLQKESSMITDGTDRTTPERFARMAWIMGYAYTESGITDVCRTNTNNNPSGSCAGVAMQIDWAAGGVKHWYNCSISRQLCGVSTRYWAGETLTIDGSSVYIGNHITGPLYRYTPHLSWGGNFRTFFNTFFGNIDYDDGYFKVYRFYNVTNGTHFYTASETEKNNVIARWPTIFRYEGIAYVVNRANGRNTLPLYRFYNLKNGTHFYTSSEAEKNNIIARWSATYRLEGVAYGVSGDPNNSTPIHRFYNLKNGTHFFTASEAEKNNVIAKWPTVYRYEGMAFFLAN